MNASSAGRIDENWLAKRFEFDKKGIISSEKMRNWGNYIEDYADLFFREDNYILVIIYADTFLYGPIKFIGL